MVRNGLQPKGAGVLPHRASKAKPKMDKSQGPEGQGELKRAEGLLDILLITAGKMEDEIGDV
jgi:hypothetical protein